MTDSKDKHDRIAARIRALLAKTVANGCTEGEALAAAAKAAEMLAANDLTEDDVRERESTREFDFGDHPVRDVVDETLWKVALAVAKLCQVRSWSDDTGGVGTKVLRFFGLAVDVEIAGYLLAICERAMRQSVEEFADGIRLRAAGRPDWANRKRRQFAEAMAERLAGKVREIAWMREREVKGIGLVTSKDGLIAAEMERRGIELVPLRPRHYDCLSDASLLGGLAAEGVGLDNALSGARPSDFLLIGRN